MPHDDPTGPSDDPNEQVFSMDPDETLRHLARDLVAGQTTIATLSRTAQSLRDTDWEDNPDAARLLANYDETLRRWITEALPSLAASMKLAGEVYDTFGPGMTTIDDPTDASIWNNKYFAWKWELTGRPAH